MLHLIGRTIGQYRIIEQVGQGGMATVYKAFQPAMERYVAIKVLPEQLAAQDPSFIERFRQEARAIAQLEHPHILPVYDYGEDHRLTYMVMRYMDSGTLTGRLKNSTDVVELIRLLGQVADALDYTHSRGIVHRDIKPSNILIDSRGEALLTDFGIAKLMEGSHALTGQGVVGTPAYMSPEQAQGLPVDGRSDIYSLGIILYEALVGHPPFEAETPVAVLLKHVHATLPLPRVLKPEIHPALEQVILKALAKNPADRYQTAGEMKRAMERAIASAGQGLTQFSVTSPPTPGSSPEPTVQTALPEDHRAVKPGQNKPRRPAVGFILPLILGVFLMGGVAWWAFQPQEPEARPQAQEMVPAGAETPTPTAVIETPTLETEPALTEEATEVPLVNEEATGADKPTPLAATHTSIPTATPTLAVPTATPMAVTTVAPALPPTPTPAQLLVATNVTGNPGKSDYPMLAVDGEGLLHLVWWDLTAKTSGDLFHRQMTPDGQWSEVEVLTEDFDYVYESFRLAHNPATGQLCIFWRGAITGTRPDTIGLYIRCQVEGTWSAAEMVRQGRGNMRDFKPAFAPDGTIHTLYIINAGDLFFEDFKLSDGFKTSIYPDFVVDQNGGYHAVWVRQGDPFTIEYRYSNDKGQTWQESERLANEPVGTLGTLGPLRLIADQQEGIHLVFVSSQNSQRGIFYRRWREGTGWEPSVELTQGEPGSSATGIGLVVDDAGFPHVFWHGLRGAFYTQMLEDETWSRPRLITDKINSGMWPGLAVDDQGIRHFAWQIREDALDLYYASLPPEGP